MNTASPLVEACDLRFAYPDREDALCGASLTISPGTRLALLGANGAGKSTLLLHFNGTLKPRTGEVRFAGRPLTYTRKGLNELRQQVAIVFQDPDDQLFAGTVWQDVSFGPMNLGLNEPEVRRRVEESLATMGLEAVAELPPHQLSYGQRKRAAIAGALAMRPRVLILDEPTAGLDPQGEDALIEKLDSLHRQGVTLIMSTHDVDLAYRWAKETAIMQAGRVIASGSSDTTLADKTLMRSAGLRVPASLTNRPIGGPSTVIPAKLFDGCG